MGGRWRSARWCRASTSSNAYAVDALGRLGGPDAEAAMLELTSEESSDVRRFAAYALSRLGTETARIQLGEMAGNDPEPSVRAAAVNSLDRKQ
jgi:HEAT repeat protein